MAITKLPRSGIADNAVNASKIEDGTIAIAEVSGTISNAKIKDGEIANAKLSNSAITVRGVSRALGSSLTVGVNLDWQSKVTSDGSTVTTMVAGRGYFVDNSSAAGIVKLPASATIGDTVAIKDYAGNFATNNLTIQRNSHNIQGNANNSLIKTNRASVELVYVDATKGWLYSDEHNVGDLEKTLFINATGGTVTESGDFKIHTFTGDGNFVVSQTGAGAGPSVVDYLVVAGGGGAGYAQNRSSGGGGAGGFREAHSTPVSGSYTASPLATPTGITLSTQTYPVTVGGGGTGGATQGTSGSNSIFSTITSAGGGAGNSKGNFPGGSPGGSGGGSGGCNGFSGGTGNQPPVSPPQGNNGGNAFGAGGPSYNPNAGGGGGGASAAGTNGSSPSAGAGGAGVTTSINGSPVTRAAGGGGGAQVASAASGGSGGGGSGAINNGTGGAGSANTGSGGGGTGTPGPGSAGGSGGAGGKGIVIIRYKFQ